MAHLDNPSVRKLTCDEKIPEDDVSRLRYAPPLLDFTRMLLVHIVLITSKFAPGLTVPIPTLPFCVITNRELLALSSAKNTNFPQPPAFQPSAVA